MDDLRSMVWAAAFSRGLAEAFNMRGIDPANVLGVAEAAAKQAVYYFDQIPPERRPGALRAASK